MFVIRLLLLLYVPAIYCKVDYYELLGVTKTATNQEIRRAFKKLAVTLHPDKNQDDPDAHEKFIKITRAYEVLKDADKRKQYDITGEDDSKAKPEYHSYTYYRDHFGIYDDDPHIVTFSPVEFETEVEDSETQWFVNFYSPMCHTCHKMAPIWRALAEKMNGAIYFGAVNCEETWSICRQQRINSYPTLVFYPSNERLMGVRSQDELEKFILSRLKSDIVYIKSKEKWNTMKETHSNWLLMLTSSFQVPTDYKIIASMLRGLIGIAVIYCQSMPCEDWDKEDGLMYMTKSNQDLWAYSPVTGGSPRETVNEVLSLLPALQKIDEEKFQRIMVELVEESAKPWLIYFHMGAETEVDSEVKKLPALLKGFNIGRLNCGRYNNVCQGLSISRYPRFAVFKHGGGWEFHHGSETAQAVATFAKEAGAATNFRTFGESEFFSEVQSGGAVFVDFYAPWCPPCLRLLPQLRKASLSFSPEQVAFATVDCTIHRELCLGQGVQSYPTTVLFNSTRKPQTFRGQTVDSIVEFVHDLINPHVIELNEDNFYDVVGKKKIGEIWMVGYFMPWCGPCQQLSPHYRKLAKMVSDMPFIKIGEVNCEVEQQLCQERGIRSYPHIHLHPHDSEGVSSVIVFNGFQRDAASLRRWLFNFVPSPVVDLTPHEFSKITSDSSVWLVDFYAPWCGHCISFEPEFKAVARKLEGKVKCGKLNCQDYAQACQRAGISGYPTLKFYSSYHQRGVEISSQQQSVIIEFVESLMLKKSRFADEL